MMDRQQPDAAIQRRAFLVRVIGAIYAAIGSAIALVLGDLFLASSVRRRRPLWLRAAPISSVPEYEPLTVTVRAARQDGFRRVVDRVVVYLVKSGDNEVRVLRSSCAHLGCRTSYNRETK